jgi:hypothetical protein
METRPSNAETAADVAIAIEHQDRVALMDALRGARGAEKLGEEEIQELADMLMEVE